MAKTYTKKCRVCGLIRSSEVVYCVNGCNNPVVVSRKSLNAILGDFEGDYITKGGIAFIADDYNCIPGYDVDGDKVSNWEREEK